MKVKLFYQGDLLNEKVWKRKEFDYSKQILDKNNIPYIVDGKDDYDVLHLNTIGHRSLIELMKARISKKKVVFQVHNDIYSFSHFGFLTRFIYGLNLYASHFYVKRADISIFNKSSVQSFFDKETPHTYLIKRGLRDSNFDISELTKLSFRRFFHINKGDKVIVGVGAICWQKGYYDFIQVAKKLPNYKFIWFGPKPSKLDFENRKYNKNLPSNVVITDYVSQECYLGAFGSADIFLLPYYEEDCSNTILKAMAGKRTVIVRDAVVNNEFIHGVHLYKGSSVNDYVWLIKNIINENLKNCGEEAQKIVRDKYSLTTNALKYLAIYQSLYKESVHTDI
jgi:1,2-diacylglycerol-3-alpha-glucose alpha-1,2-glucosyltransferase